MIKFAAYEVALQLNEALCPIAERIRQRSRSLADQLERSAQSIALNVAEGNRRAGRDRVHLFRIAEGSANEAKACLDIARCWRIVDAETVASLDSTFGRQLALLRGLTR